MKKRSLDFYISFNTDTDDYFRFSLPLNFNRTLPTEVMRSSAPTRKVALRSSKIFAQKAMDFGALRGEYQPYEGGAVDQDQILEEEMRAASRVIASLKVKEPTNVSMIPCLL